jgi:type VI secretion system protein ImpH
MLTILCGTTLEFEVKLILRQQDVTGCRLGARDSGPDDGRLGWDTFLCSRPAQQDRSDAQYTLAPLH